MKEQNKKIDFEKEQIKDGFAPDDGYLAQLESTLFETLNIEEKFTAQEDGFAQDDACLDALESNILKAVAIEQEENKVGKVVKLLSYKKIYVAAASIAAIMVLTISISKFTPSHDVQFAGLTQESEEWYLNQRALFLTEDDLSLLLEDKVFEIEIEDEALQKELEDYILENEHFLHEL